MAKSQKHKEIQHFKNEIIKPHHRIDPCFMTGKGCVYIDSIDRTINERKSKQHGLGFSVMPFRENLNTFYNNCLARYFYKTYKNQIELQRADEVKRPGIIICEGVCKRLQESDFVTVDISLPNPNVFYELGLAIGISHKILIICHDTAEFGRKIAEQLKHLDCKVYFYHGLDPIETEFASQYIWQLPHEDTSIIEFKEHVLLYEHVMDNNDIRLKETFEASHGDIKLNFETHIKSAVSLAIDEINGRLNDQDQPVISKHRDTIKKLHSVEIVPTDSNFREIQNLIDSAYCIIIRTGFDQCHPMAYFWLGYGHAKGKNVIPVTILRERGDSVEDLAFDIRAQRHMFFIEKYPDRFINDLTATFEQVIFSDFSEWSRKRFWDLLIGRRGEVSIFTGALYNDAFKRQMIGDWDLRTASELTSYLASKQYRAKIENPVYSPDNPKINKEDIPSYITQLKDMLKDKNCIIVASPDVNPLAEIVLGAIYSVNDKNLFNNRENINKHPNAIVVVKERERKPEDASPPRWFYREIPPSSLTELKRGFQCAHLREGEAMEKYINQTEGEHKPFNIFGLLAITPNPFRSTNDGDQRYIIVLNGVSGPATFALTHVLTGGVTKEFVAYEEGFNPEAESEKILHQLIQHLSSARQSAVDCIISVSVGPKDQHNDSPISTSDWRKILHWKLNERVRRPAIRALPPTDKPHIHQANERQVSSNPPESKTRG